MIAVKICGITNMEDALLAVEAGADYLGFIFYPPSKRSIGVRPAQQIVAQLRQRADCPTLVGVFVDETAVDMAQLLDSVGLDLAQLSGSEVPALIGDKDSPIYGRSYKAIKPTSMTEAEAEAEWFAVDGKPSLLVDAYHPTMPGGTGELSDWGISAKLAQKLPGLMLAGGLTPDNVGAAVAQVRPFAVDVASGVEASPGKKEPDKVKLFIQRAKATL